MIKETKIKKTGRFRLTFTLPAANATSVQLAGEFSEWMPIEMHRPKGATDRGGARRRTGNRDHVEPMGA